MKKIFLFLTLLTLFAVTGKAETISYSFSNSQVDGTEVPTLKMENSGIELSFNKNGNSNATKYYNSTHIRLYAKNQLIIKSDRPILAVQIQYVSSTSNILNSGSSVTNGKFESGTPLSKWTVDGSYETILTNGGTSGHARITDILISVQDQKVQQPLELSWTYGGQTLAADYVHEVVYEDIEDELVYDLPTLVGADGLDVTWTISPEDDADIDVDDETGKPYIMFTEDDINKEFTVTATVAESTEYFGDSASYKIRVISNTAPAKETIDLKWTYNGRDLEEGETITLTLPVDEEWTAHPVLVVTTEGDFTPQYSANNDNVIMVDEEGELWLLGGEAGEATVTATIPASDDYYTATRTFKLVVERAAVNLSFSAADATVDLADNTTWTNVPTLSGAPEGVTVTYTSSDPTVATVNEQGAITPLKKGTTVIKAVTAADKTYAEGGATYNLTVTDSTPVVGFQLLTDINDLHYGDEIIIAGKKNNLWYAMSTTPNSGNSNFAEKKVSISNDNTINDTDGLMILTLEKSSLANCNYALKIDENKYLLSSTAKILKTGTSSSTAGTGVNITLNQSTNVATIQFGTTNIFLRLNSTSALFNTYTSGQEDVYIYYKSNSSIKLKDPNLVWSLNDNSVNDQTIEVIKEENATSKLPILKKDTSASVNYTSTDESVAKIDKDGNISILSTGITTITAGVDSDGDYNFGSASYTLYVTSNLINEKYEKIYSVSDLKDGDCIVIAGINTEKTEWGSLSSDIQDTSIGVAKVSVNDDVLTLAEETLKITLESADIENNFHLFSDKGYLKCAKVKELTKTDTKDDSTKVSISINEETGVATISFGEKINLYYNPSASMFRTYAQSGTTARDVYIFKASKIAEVASFDAMKDVVANISEELIDEVIFDFGKDNYLKAYGTRGEGGYTYITDSQEMVHGIRLENLPSDFDHEKDLIGLRAYYRVNEHGIAHLEYISATAYNMDFSTVVGKHFDRLDEFDPADHIHTLVTFPSVTYTNGKLVNAASPANIRGARVAAADGIKVLESEHLTAEHEGLTKSVTGIVEHDGTDYAILPTSVGEQATGIEGVEADSDVVAVIGRDILAPEGAEVYAVNGARVSANGLAAGVYVVRLADGRAVKVLVK